MPIPQVAVEIQYCTAIRLTDKRSVCRVVNQLVSHSPSIYRPGSKVKLRTQFISILLTEVGLDPGTQTLDLLQTVIIPHMPRFAHIHALTPVMKIFTR